MVSSPSVSPIRPKDKGQEHGYIHVTYSFKLYMITKDTLILHQWLNVCIGIKCPQTFYVSAARKNYFKTPGEENITMVTRYTVS